MLCAHVRRITQSKTRGQHREKKAAIMVPHRNQWISCRYSSAAPASWIDNVALAASSATEVARRVTRALDGIDARPSLCSSSVAEVSYASVIPTWAAVHLATNSSHAHSPILSYPRNLARKLCNKWVCCCFNSEVPFSLLSLFPFSLSLSP